MAFKISTLNQCNKIAATMDPKRYLSKDGSKLVAIIRRLLPESGGQPAAVCAQLRAIGKTYKWDLPRISAGGEASFLLWLVMEVAKTAVPVPAVSRVVPGPVSQPFSGRRER